MDAKGIKHFLSGRVPLSGHLSDYALLVGQNNQMLQSIQWLQDGSIGPLIIPAKPNRIALQVTAFWVAGTVNAANLLFRDDNGNQLFLVTILKGEADVASVTPSPANYNPLFITVFEMGPLIQRQIRINNATATTQVMVNEVLMNPPCCEYIGGMERTGWPQAAFNPKSNEPLER